VGIVTDNMHSDKGDDASSVDIFDPNFDPEAETEDQKEYRLSQESLLTNYFSFGLYLSSMILPG